MPRRPPRPTLFPYTTLFRSVPTPVAPPYGGEPSLALSLSVLQAETAAGVRARQAVPDELGHLGGLNCFQGLMVETGGEVILLGSHDASSPRLHLDDLVVSLRNAYQISAAYQ